MKSQCLYTESPSGIEMLLLPCNLFKYYLQKPLFHFLLCNTRIKGTKKKEIKKRTEIHLSFLHIPITS